MTVFLGFFRHDVSHQLSFLPKEHATHFDLSLQASQIAPAGIIFTKSVKIHSKVLVIGLFNDQEILRKVQQAS
jgi:uncharacterized membrane protein